MLKIGSLKLFLNTLLCKESVSDSDAEYIFFVLIKVINLLPNYVSLASDSNFSSLMDISHTSEMGRLSRAPFCPFRPSEGK